MLKEPGRESRVGPRWPRHAVSNRVMGASLAFKAGCAHSLWIKKIFDIQLLWTRIQLRCQRRINLLHLL